jgi:hypothetical protein
MTQERTPHKPTRRQFVKKAAYITPAILTLAVAPAYAKAGSEKGGGKEIREKVKEIRNDEKGKELLEKLKQAREKEKSEETLEKIKQALQKGKS